MVGPRAPFAGVEHDPPVDELSEEFPLRLTTGRHLDSYNTGVQTGPLRLAAPPEASDRLSSRGRLGGWGVAEGDLVRVISRRGAVVAPVALRRRAAAGARLHDPPLPRPGGHQRADDRRRRSAAPAPRSSRPRRCGSSRWSSRRRSTRLVGDGHEWICTSRPTSPIRRRRRPSTPVSPAPPNGAPPAVPAPRPARHPGPQGLDQPGRAQLRLPAAGGAAGRGLRRGRLLRPLPDPAPSAGRPCTSATTSPARRAAPRRSARRSSGASAPRGRAGTATPPGTAAPASASASGRPRRWWWRPAVRRAIRRWRRPRAADVLAAARGRSPSRQPDLAALRAAGGTAGPEAAAPASAGSIPRAWTTTAPPAASWPCAAPSRWARRRWCGRWSTPSWWAAAAPPSPPA